MGHFVGLRAGGEIFTPLEKFIINPGIKYSSNGVYAFKYYQKT